MKFPHKINLPGRTRLGIWGSVIRFDGYIVAISLPYGYTPVIVVAGLAKDIAEEEDD